MHLWRALQGQSTLRSSLWSSVGKSGDLGDHPGNKIKALFHCDWDHYCMFPSWMACGAITFHVLATPPLLYISVLACSYLYIVDLGAPCSPKSSLSSHP